MKRSQELEVVEDCGQYQTADVKAVSMSWSVPASGPVFASCPVAHRTIAGGLLRRRLVDGHGWHARLLMITSWLRLLAHRLHVNRQRLLRGLRNPTDTVHQALNTTRPRRQGAR